jgi:hypothetical protein
MWFAEMMDENADQIAGLVAGLAVARGPMAAGLTSTRAELILNDA